VRGRGAMIAMELVTDPDTKEPAAALTAAVNKGCHERGLITLTCGTYGNVFRFLPPLSISDDLLHEGMDVLEESFTAAVG
jgi:4-aminobutyrate aminotransferase / (S)-3-amino-2-methylpropionate transaminase / 5-aminovalerate transaminase